jgi:hypothetical protein
MLGLCAGLAIAGAAWAAPVPAATQADAGANAATRAVQAQLLDQAALSDLRMGEGITLAGFPLSASDSATLELQRFTNLTADARVVIVGADGVERPADTGLVLLRGRIAGDEGSRVLIGLSPWGTNGFVQRGDGSLFVVSTGDVGNAANLGDALRVTDTRDLPAGWFAAPACGTTPDRVDLALPAPVPTGTPAVTRDDCRVARIAIDTDWEFTQRLFAGNAQAAAAYAQTLLAAVSEIYQRDVATTLVVPFLRVWSADVDPYNATTDPLDLVRDHWNAQMGSVDRTVTHLLTGRTNMSYGGVAYLNALCASGFGYGVSGYLEGSFPYPLVDYNGQNWDVVVCAHELGHNFGTPHTHDFNPPIDRCGIDCTGNLQSTIMSYCHICAGGLPNIRLGFHPRVITTIVNYMNSLSSCDLSAPTADIARDDAATTAQGVSVDVAVLANDLKAGCDGGAPSIVSFDATSAAGGSVSLIPGAGIGADALRYAPAPGFTGADAFSYSIGSASASVAVDVQPLRAAETPLFTKPGLLVQYYETPSLSFLPDFDALTPYRERTVLQLNFGTTNGQFSNSGRSDDVSALYTGYVEVATSGLYTFYTSSDDGSRLYIGDQLVVDNDGLHGMTELSGQIGLQAGLHTLRIEYFEAGGGAGLIASYAGPAFAKRVIPQGALEQDDCGIDFNNDGVVDFGDVNLFVFGFQLGLQDVDLNSDGVIDFGDVMLFVDLFNAGC